MENWDQSAKDLPSVVVIAVWFFHILEERQDNQGVDGPGEDKLDWEAEPKLEDLVRLFIPFGLTYTAHNSANWSYTFK